MMRVFGLIGFPLSHSFSKKYFTEKFEKEKLHDCSYENFPISSIELLPGILNTPGLEGLNVTIPYKESVLRFLDTATDEVKEIAACNCIRIENKRLHGFNTDIIGFRESIIKNLQPYHKKALILGTGGSAKAVAFTLKKLKIATAFASRTDHTAWQYEQLTKEIITDHSVIINTTPVGMWPKSHLAPAIPYEFLTNKHFLFDLVYNPEKTLFLQRGMEMGATVQNGQEMLIIQAEESWKIWNNH